MVRVDAPLTSRADTIWSVAVAALSVLLVVFGLVGLLLGAHDVRTARAQLASTVLSEARSQHLSPRDPRVLDAVRRRLRNEVVLQPSPTVSTTGRVEVVFRRVRHGRTRACLVLPATTSGHLRSCASPAAAAAAGRRTVLEVRP